MCGVHVQVFPVWDSFGTKEQSSPSPLPHQMISACVCCGLRRLTRSCEERASPTAIIHLPQLLREWRCSPWHPQASRTPGRGMDGHQQSKTQPCGITCEEPTKESCGEDAVIRCALRCVYSQLVVFLLLVKRTTELVTADCGR